MARFLARYRSAVVPWAGSRPRSKRGSLNRSIVAVRPPTIRTSVKKTATILADNPETTIFSILMPVDIGSFTKIPNRFFGSGKAAALGSSASLLYIALCERANRDGSNSFKASDRTIAADTGLSPRTIFDARKRLIENQLVSCNRGEGESYFYTLGALTLPWVPVKQRPRAKRKPRALHALRSIPSEAPH